MGGLTPLELPTDQPRPAVQTFHGALHQRRLPRALSQQLHELSQREGVTLFMTLLAAFQVLLSRYSGQQDIAVGTPIANRTREEVEGLIGFFVNTLVLRSDLSGNPAFIELLARVRTMALGAYAHQDVPFEQVVEALQPQRDLSRSPLFQVLFELQSMGNGEELPGSAELQAENVALEQHSAKFELSVVVNENPEGLQITLEYNTDLFAASTIDRLLAHFQTLLEGIVSSPKQRIATLPLLTTNEYEQLIRHHNQTQKEIAPPLHYILHLARQVARTPERIAVCDPQQQLTYAALWQRSERLACMLQQRGIGPETLVGLYMERSCELLISVLAIWHCAAAYVPLDPAYPRERVQVILEQAQVSLLLTTASLQEHIPSNGAPVVCLEKLDTPGPASESPLYDITLLPQHLAYVIYTSGSTGTPKGVMVNHEGMLNHLMAKVYALELSDKDIIAQTASACFDISVWQFLAGLLQAGKVEILPNIIAHDPYALLRSVQEKEFSILQVVPSMLAVMLDEPKAADLPDSRLRWLIATGEAMPKALCQRWWREDNDILLLNAYGPTECSDDVTHALLRREQNEHQWRVPIGFPIINTQIYLLDTHMQLVPQGVIGEIYVGGTGVGRGYLRDAGRTAEVFVPDPYGPLGSRLYRTGDLGRYRPDGQLEFVERYDGQVKLRGYRIELGEIEAHIARHPQVKQSVVILHGREPQEKRLVAYIVGEEQRDVAGFNTETLADFLKGDLPEYMIPDHFVWLETLPLTPNGKVDRASLPEPRWSNGKIEKNEEKKLLQPVEELVLQVWKQVLQRDQVGLQENFFELGGHSLLATQVVARLRKLLHTEVPLLLLFEAPTISLLAARLQLLLRQAQGHTQPMPPLLPVPRDQDLPLSFAQQRLWFLHQFAPRSAAYSIPVFARLHGTLAIPALRASLSALIQRHESLRTVFEERQGQVLQRIVQQTPIPFPVIDLSGYDHQQHEAAIEQLVEQEAEQPFDLRQGPLLRSWLLRLSPQEHILFLTMHHIVSDGWSMGILVQELTALYQAFRAGEPSPLPSLPIQYADYASWQRGWLQGEVLKEQIRYWTQQLNGARALELPTDYPRTRALSQQGAHYGFQLDAQLAQALRQLSQQEGRPCL
ncbi:hypothetical protein KSC_090830 [Ktedonobacter sp. SOSP1-52]|nr:hypothetical protein KSC_090830 [Ktedonobacter sp. SOSP1-52]